MILVYGGTFNPPTKAHYEIAKALIAKYKPQGFYFLPVGDKYNKDGIINFKYRYEMLSLLCQKLPNTFVSNLENCNCFKGTYHSLKAFKKLDKDIYFVMGSDNLSYLNHWIKADKLVSEFKFICINRGSYDDLSFIKTNFSRYQDHFILFDYHNQISSSAFRKNKDASYLCRDIYEYVVTNKLYEV